MIQKQPLPLEVYLGTNRENAQNSLLANADSLETLLQDTGNQGNEAVQKLCEYTIASLGHTGIYGESAVIRMVDILQGNELVAFGGRPPCNPIPLD